MSLEDLNRVSDPNTRIDGRDLFTDPNSPEAFLQSLGVSKAELLYYSPQEIKRMVMIAQANQQFLIDQAAGHQQSDLPKPNISAGENPGDLVGPNPEGQNNPDAYNSELFDQKEV